MALILLAKSVQRDDRTSNTKKKNAGGGSINKKNIAKNYKRLLRNKTIS